MTKQHTDADTAEQCKVAGARDNTIKMNGYRSDEETSHDSGSYGSGDTTRMGTASVNQSPSKSPKSAAATASHSSSKDNTVICPSWTSITDMIHRSIGRFVIALSMRAARNPVICITSIVSLSFALLAVGFTTNFYVNVEAFELYAPFNSIPQEHRYWTLEQSGFPERKRAVTLIVHNNGENMLSIEPMEKVFEAMDTVRSTPGYRENCEGGDFWDKARKEYTCRIISPTRAWYHSDDQFRIEVKSDQDLIEAVSASKYPGGEPVNHEYIMGNLIKDENGTITYAPAYFVYLVLSNKGDETKELETRITERLLALQADWDNDIGTDHELHLDFFTARTRSDEFSRAIEEDVYLVGCIFLVMSVFTCLVFFKSDRVQSRCLLGVGSVFTISMSLCSGFGIMFLFGVPFTSMTQLIPFLLFGVGLDDTFIITGSYLRTDPSREPEERIRTAMEEVGSSISLTTITTATAFLLGLSSSVPAIYWVCLYAFPCVVIDFIYQITLFIAILVLDERRIRARRVDCFVCCKVRGNNDSNEEEGDNQGGDESSKHIADRVMAKYGKLLLRPVTKVVVVLVFVAFLALCIYRASMLTQEFDFKELFPEGSYATSAFNALEKYNDKTLPLSMTFRDVNQSDPLVQQQMKAFIEEVTELPAFHEQPPFCWVQDFDRFHEIGLGDAVANMTFNEKVDFALSNPSLREVYGDDIVRDQEGNIIASRCTVLVRNSHVDDVEGMIDLLMMQREVTDDQAINHGRRREAFFTYSDIYLFWEFYSIAVDELILTTILNITAVTVIAFIFIPHFSAALFILPLIISININLLGVIQMAGLHINAVTYVCLVISIGLIVDFLMHIILRYNESKLSTRDARVKETLETMGASILLGGLSTFLGAFPLAFSTSIIIRTVFTCFCSMVVLGVTHGLILLPVLLSVVGPVPKAGALTDEQPQDEKTAMFSEIFFDKSSLDGKPSDEPLSPCNTVETELDDSVEDFLVAVAEDLSQYEFANDENAAQKGKEELIRLYSSIYAKTSDPEAFIQKLIDEVNAKKRMTIEDTC